MTDIDYCDGKNCPLSKVCQRYADYLYRLEKKKSVQYARTGQMDCPQFKPKVFMGN